MENDMRNYIYIIWNRLYGKQILKLNFDALFGLASYPRK